MLIILLGVIALLFMFKDRPIDNQVTIDGYKTHYFSPESKKLFDQLPSNNSKREFAIMEDLFNKYEKLTVCGGMSHLRLATELDQQMKERFRGWNLSYHQRVLNQIAQPSKNLDPNLRC
jgi:hypothetical protein